MNFPGISVGQLGCKSCQLVTLQVTVATANDDTCYRNGSQYCVKLATAEDSTRILKWIPMATIRKWSKVMPIKSCLAVVLPADPIFWCCHIYRIGNQFGSGSCCGKAVALAAQLIGEGGKRKNKASC